MTKHYVRVYDWNPNGTNDIEVVNGNGEVVAGIQEALFGVDATITDQLTIKQALKLVACSPVDPDGDTVTKELVKYDY